MYFCRAIIAKALEHLQDVHPFFLITFLAYKEIDLPIINLPTDKLKDTRGVERNFLERYYRPTKEYDGYFRPSRVSDKSKMWVPKKYPDAGLQSVRTRNLKISDALLHDHRGGYGWSKDYVQKLRSVLKDNVRLPAFYISIWLYRDIDWPNYTTAQDIIMKFKIQFKITQEEEEFLFDMSIPSDLNEKELLCNEPVGWSGLKTIEEFIVNYPGAPLEEGGVLQSLSLNGVGPIDKLIFEPGERLNIIAGDNGLGKTFLLDSAWWALCGNWASKPIHPRADARWSSPSIKYTISTSDQSDEITAKYNWERPHWYITKERTVISGLLIYARIDRSFAIWDPAKYILYNSIRRGGEKLSLDKDFSYVDPVEILQGQLILSDEEVLNGKRSKTIYGEDRVLCNGLTQDIMTWSADSEGEAFTFFNSALDHLSPPGFKLAIGKPVRIAPDIRDILTITHPYGDVPIVDLSAGIRRILCLAYWKSVV